MKDKMPNYFEKQVQASMLGQAEWPPNSIEDFMHKIFGIIAAEELARQSASRVSYVLQSREWILRPNIKQPKPLNTYSVIFDDEGDVRFVQAVKAVSPLNALLSAKQFLADLGTEDVDSLNISVRLTEKGRDDG